MASSHTFKIATEPWEFEQINKLNYETFVEEIPQHRENDDRVLVDKYDKENTYLICVADDEVLGMLAVRGRRPFSLDQKLKDLDSYLPPHNSICEVRLLAARKTRRHSRVVYGLLRETVRYCLDNGHDIAVISGVLDQQRLYEHMGFVAFGPVVGKGDTLFQPMYLTPRNYSRTKKPALKISAIPPGPVVLTPGPVDVSPSVRRAFGEKTLSHRSREFMAVHAETKRLLRGLVNAEHVELFMGSGTLANDIIAGQLTLEDKRGLILSNGEFGNRLIDCADRLDLDFETVQLDWGEAFDADLIDRVIDEASDIGWLWAVHCETSTGMLNDLTLLKRICQKYGIRLCLDCISSVGTVPLDLEGVYLASAVSGKGFCSFSGLSMVFYNHKFRPPQKKLPRYLDLYNYAQNSGVPFTVLSNLVSALNAALKDMDIDAKFRTGAETSRWLRNEIRAAGLQILVSDEHSSPAVFTICIPRDHSSLEVGNQLEQKGFFTHYKSHYLTERNWLQICMMSDVSPQTLMPLLSNLRDILT